MATARGSPTTVLFLGRHPDVAVPNSGTEQYYQAMNEWRSVLGQDPGNIEARLGRARGDRAVAAQEYLRILQIVPDQPEARRELARLGRGPGS